MHVQLGGALAVSAELAGWIVGLSHLAQEHIWIFCWGWNVLIGESEVRNNLRSLSA